MRLLGATDRTSNILRPDQTEFQVYENLYLLRTPFSHAAPKRKYPGTFLPRIRINVACADRNSGVFERVLQALGIFDSLHSESGQSLNSNLRNITNIESKFWFFAHVTKFATIAA